MEEENNQLRSWSISLINDNRVIFMWIWKGNIIYEPKFVCVSNFADKITVEKLLFVKIVKSCKFMVSPFFGWTQSILKLVNSCANKLRSG